MAAVARHLLRSQGVCYERNNSIEDVAAFWIAMCLSDENARVVGNHEIVHERGDERVDGVKRWFFGSRDCCTKIKKIFAITEVLRKAQTNHGYYSGRNRFPSHFILVWVVPVGSNPPDKAELGS